MDSNRGNLIPILKNYKTTFLNEEYTFKIYNNNNNNNNNNCTNYTTKCFHNNDLKEFKLDAFKTFAGSEFQSCTYLLKNENLVP